MFGLFSKKNKEDLDKGLDKSKKSLLTRINRTLVGKSRVDQAVLDDLEEILIESDVGVDTTLKIIENLEKIAKEEKYVSTEELNQLLVRSADMLLAESESEQSTFGFDLEGAPKPYVMMVVGVNGVGKTTTIGKLANQFKKAGKSVCAGSSGYVPGSGCRPAKDLVGTRGCSYRYPRNGS